jgi:hypothetical protein
MYSLLILIFMDCTPYGIGDAFLSCDKASPRFVTIETYQTKEECLKAKQTTVVDGWRTTNYCVMKD